MTGLTPKCLHDGDIGNVGFNTMLCTTPKLLALVVVPMIALQLGKDPVEISDLLERYLSSHDIDNDKMSCGHV